MAALLEEQQERLRRAVDEWRIRSYDILKNLHGNTCDFSPSIAADYSASPPSDPVQLHVEPMDHTDLLVLLDSDNVAVSKLVTVLSFDCIEISKLHRFASQNLYRQLLLFGHSSSSQESLLEGDPQKVFGRLMALFMKLHDSVTRLTEVIENLIQQLNSICSFDNKNVRQLNSLKNFKFRTAFESLGEALAVFLVLDEILKENGRIKAYLSHFARMLSKVKSGADTFGISLEDLEFLDHVVRHLQKLLDAGLFQRLLQGESSLLAACKQVKCNRIFIDACSCCIQEVLSETLPRIDTSKEFPLDRTRIFYHVALFLFATYSSAEPPEKKIWKLILETLQVVPVIYLEGGKRVQILEVLKWQSPQLLSIWPPMKEALRDLDVMKGKYLEYLSGVHSRDWQAIRDALVCWAAWFHSSIHPSSDIFSAADLNLHVERMMQGIFLANRIRVFVLSMLDLHSSLEIPIKREKLKSLCQMVISLKILGKGFQKKMLETIQTLPHMLNSLQSDMEQILLPLKDKLHAEAIKASKRGKLNFLSSLTRGNGDIETRLTDSLSMVLMSLHLLQGDGSYKRQCALSTTLDIIGSIGHCDIDFLRFRKFLSKLAVVADFQSIVKELTDCSFLYWRREMMGNCFSMVYTDVSKFSWLQCLLDAFSDGLWLLKFGEVGELTLRSYERELENALKVEIVSPLCRDIETDLRLHVHSTHSRGDVFVNPRKTGVRNLSWYLQMKPLQLPFKFIDVRLVVENYLNSAFYNHAAMPPHDWKIYTEMQQLAELKYTVVLDDIHLNNFLDRGLDVNEVVLNLPTTAENYMYDILQQVLIEKTPNGHSRKNLRVISIEQAASSIATHGLQTIHTASNSVVNFLVQLLATLCELFQDNYVRSHLVKEPDFWKSYSIITNQHPALQPGENNVVRGNAHLRDHKVSLVKQLRSTITRMGNGLGLMRILLAGFSYQSYNASWFTSKEGRTTNFMEDFQKLNFPDGVVDAGRVMDTTLKSLAEFDNHSEMFSSFITSTSKDLESSICYNLRDFYLAIPSIVLNIDSHVHCEDRPLRVNTESGNIVLADDGFAMGVAYVLKVMKQDKLFDELNWFASARKSLEEAISLLEEPKVPDRKGSSFAGLKIWSQTPSISDGTRKEIDELKKYRHKLEFIECSLNIARTIMASN